MNVEIGAEAALFPEKEYIKGIFVAVHFHLCKKELQYAGQGTPYHKSDAGTESKKHIYGGQSLCFL